MSFRGVSEYIILWGFNWKFQYERDWILYLLSPGWIAEYDWSTNNLLNEFESKLNPFSIYGKSKLKSFYETTNYFEKNFASMSWIRLFNPFGPGEDERRLIPKLCINLFKDQIQSNNIRL